MAVLTQLCMASIGVLIGYVLFMENRWVVLDLVQAAVSLIFIIVIFNRLLPYLFFVRTRGEWLVHWVPVLRGLIYLALPATLILGFGLSVASLTREHGEKEPEHPSEAVDALIEAGQEEGILEESDRDLIQSVVEFGDKTVREVMTPRPEIVAVPVTTTIAGVHRTDQQISLLAHSGLRRRHRPHQGNCVRQGPVAGCRRGSAHARPSAT